MQWPDCWTDVYSRNCRLRAVLLMEQSKVRANPREPATGLEGCKLDVKHQTRQPISIIQSFFQHRQVPRSTKVSEMIG